MNTSSTGRMQHAPRGLAAYNQFISWRLIDRNGPKPDKVPCDAYGNPCDPHAPANWVSWEVAASRPWGVGFVFTRDDPFFFLDFDSALIDGQWSMLVQQEIARFQGAYFEISQSGKGLHIIGAGSFAIPEGHATRKRGVNAELYTRGRFVALTGWNMAGDAALNCAGALMGFVQHHGFELVNTQVAKIDEGRDPKWAGPEDDDELIAMALAQRVNAPQGFGHTPTFRELWEMDVAALARKKPAEGRADGLPFEYNQIDASLMAHLSYFTGRDMPRMVRIFERWKGFRTEKYQARPDLMTRLLTKGSSNPNVMHRPAATVPTEQPLPRDERYDDYLAHLPSNTYYHIPTGQFFPAATIDNVLFPMDVGEEMGSGTRKTMKATKWLSRNKPVHQSTWMPGAPRVIDGWVYDDGVMVQHPGMMVLNLYRDPTPPQPRGGPVDRWIDHVRAIYPRHWQEVLAWMAFVAQHPTIKMNFALVLGGSQGIGKDSILAPLERVVGGRNWRETSPEVILTSQFTEYLQCRVLRINEAKDTGGESRFQFYEKCKTIIAAPPNVHSINAKGQRPYQIPNLNATIITTNHRTGGLYLPADDRRHLVVFSDAVRTQFSDAYWNDYHQWMGNGGIEDCAAWLLSFDVTRFNPKVPTQTDAFLEMVEGGQSADHHDLADLVEMAGSDPFTIEKLAFLAMGNGDRELAEDLRNRGKLPKIKRALIDLGFVQYKNPNDMKRGRWMINGKLVTLYKRQPV